MLSVVTNIFFPSILASQNSNSPQEKLLKTLMPSWRNCWMKQRTVVIRWRSISSQKNSLVSHLCWTTFQAEPLSVNADRWESFWGCFSLISDWIWGMFRRQEDIFSSRTEKVRKSVTLNQQPSDWSLNAAKKIIIIIISIISSGRSVCFRCCPVFLGGSSVVNGVGTVTSKRWKLMLLS